VCTRYTDIGVSATGRHFGVSVPGRHFGVSAPGRHLGVSATSRHFGVSASGRHVSEFLYQVDTFRSVHQVDRFRSVCCRYTFRSVCTRYSHFGVPANSNRARYAFVRYSVSPAVVCVVCQLDRWYYEISFSCCLCTVSILIEMDCVCCVSAAC
jgi:hypothetical protein